MVRPLRAPAAAAGRRHRAVQCFQAMTWHQSPTPLVLLNKPASVKPAELHLVSHGRPQTPPPPIKSPSLACALHQRVARKLSAILDHLWPRPGSLMIARMVPQISGDGTQLTTTIFLPPWRSMKNTRDSTAGKPRPVETRVDPHTASSSHAKGIASGSRLPVKGKAICARRWTLHQTRSAPPLMMSERSPPTASHPGTMGLDNQGLTESALTPHPGLGGLPVAGTTKRCPKFDAHHGPTRGAGLMAPHQGRHHRSGNGTALRVLRTKVAVMGAGRRRTRSETIAHLA